MPPQKKMITLRVSSEMHKEIRLLASHTKGPDGKPLSMEELIRELIRERIRKLQ